MFWHNKDKGDERAEADTTGQTSSADMVAQKQSIKERLGIPPAHKLQLNNTIKNKAAAAAVESSDKVSVKGVLYLLEKKPVE